MDREQVQDKALDIALSSNRCGLGISMGVGKTLIALRYIEYLQSKNMNKLNILVAAPKRSIFETWKAEAEKFGIDISKVVFTTYLSLNKHSPYDYNVIILDEMHNLLEHHTLFLERVSGRILGLSGTPPKHEGSEKGKMVNKYCPVKFTYIVDEAVDDDILNDYRIIVHRMPLSTRNTIKVSLKDKEFYTSEQKNYDYWTERVEDAIGAKQRQITSVMRMRALMEFKTKEDYAKKLMNDVEEKCLVFANTQAQADRICTHSIHSKNQASDENLQKLRRGDIDKASCVLQISEGINIDELRIGIIMHAYGNERKLAQRIGRFLRLNPGEMSIIHILMYKNTVDERWTETSLEDLDPKKIKYFDVKAE